MNVLVIGSGGREHALIYALNNSPTAEKIYALPGNGGINDDAQEVDCPLDDYDAIVDFCKSKNIGLVIVGPEAPLVDGMVDVLEANGIKAFGPGKAAAQLEGSKQFMKDMVKKYGVATAEYETFTDAQSAKEYVKQIGAPIVVKTDGLAAGKGVTVAQTEEEAIKAIDEAFGGKFGDAGKKLVIEEFLAGEEASFFAICDGKTAIAFGSAQDHKTVGEGDTGPNTGGMGTYSPAPVMPESLENQVMKEIIEPVIKGLEKEGTPYKGVLFAGLMIADNKAKLLEFNIRFGDPECQVLMARLKSDILPILLASVEGNIEGKKAEFSDNTALCVVMAAKGYPESYKKGSPINNLDDAGSDENTIIFHAGTKYEKKQLVANGGRVLGVTALGKDVVEAQKRAYEAVDKIDWKDGFCRRDIGWRAVNRFKKVS